MPRLAGRWLRVPAGQRILSKGDSRAKLCLLVEGVAGLSTDYGGIEECRLMFSGDMWDLALCRSVGACVRVSHAMAVFMGAVKLSGDRWDLAL